MTILFGSDIADAFGIPRLEASARVKYTDDWVRRLWIARVDGQNVFSDTAVLAVAETAAWRRGVFVTTAHMLSLMRDGRRLGAVDLPQDPVAEVLGQVNLFVPPESLSRVDGLSYFMRIDTLACTVTGFYFDNPRHPALITLESALVAVAQQLDDAQGGQAQRLVMLWQKAIERRETHPHE